MGLGRSSGCFELRAMGCCAFGTCYLAGSTRFYHNGHKGFFTMDTRAFEAANKGFCYVFLSRDTMDLLRKSVPRCGNK